MSKGVTLAIAMCVCSSLLSGLGVYAGIRAKQSGSIEGTEEYYIKKYELDVLKKILVDAIVANTVIYPPPKTLYHFADTDEFIDYQIQMSAENKKREEDEERSAPHINNIREWCAKHCDALESFLKSGSIRITRLDGSQLTSLEFYNMYMEDVSEDGKRLLIKISKSM
jgi:hypothetical protein